MSEFYNGNYKGVEFSTYPLNTRKNKKARIFWHLPHWTSQRIVFQVALDSANTKKLLYELPIFVKFTDSSGEASRVEESNECVLSDNGNVVTITTDGLRGSGILKYYLGSPNASNSGAIVIAEFQANWRDKKWLLLYGVIGGFLSSLIIFILGILSRAISVNIELIADLF